MLTDDEIQGIHDQYYRRMGPQEFAREIQIALLAKLAVAEMPEYAHRVQLMSGREVIYYTEAQLKAYGAACAAKERAALMQLFTDPENQPTQYGTVLLSAEPVVWKYTSKLAGNQWFLTSYQSDLSTYKADKVIPLFTRSTT